jgi:hypothetical protein
VAGIGFSQLARLVLHFELLAAAPTNFAVDDPWRTPALAAQALFLHCGPCSTFGYLMAMG